MSDRLCHALELIAKAYACHLISFTAGAIGGGITVASALLAAKAAGVF